MTPENEKSDLLLYPSLFLSDSPHLAGSLNIQDLRGVVARTVAFAPSGWIDLERIAIRSPRNGFLNIGHRKRESLTHRPVFRQTWGIILLAWPVVYIGRRRTQASVRLVGLIG